MFKNTLVIAREVCGRTLSRKSRSDKYEKLGM
jgi:hypothetical protein